MVNLGIPTRARMNDLSWILCRGRRKRGQLGGFLARKHDGVPRVKTLWLRILKIIKTQKSKQLGTNTVMIFVFCK